ncbi:MAG: MinD/ParA family protein [Chloroflexi bacterium]|nr:MinD/ParA family protein [Chloroflexota bacterium]
MTKIISLHSFRGGTGKSNTTANVAALLAAQGKRVGVVDTDIQSPGIHVLFGLDASKLSRSLNDYLWGRCEITDAAHDVTANVGGELSGKILLVPSSINANDIARVLRDRYDVALLNDGFRKLARDLALDALLIDTHPGLNEETLLSMTLSHVLAVVMRPDQQDYEGTGVTIAVARKLRVPRLLIIVNKTPSAFDADDVKRRVEQTYACEVAAVLPHSDDLMVLSSAGVFALRYPEHRLTHLYHQIVARLDES